MTEPARSGCPLNLAMQVLGDRWSLVILRDMMFSNRRHFRDLLAHSREGIASNILAARLKDLQAQGLVSRRDDPSHKQKVIYSLTERAIQLVPAIVALGTWGRRHLRAAPELLVHNRLLDEGGPSLQERFMDELRRLHLGEDAAPPDPQGSVLDSLNAAFLAHLAEGAEAQNS